MSHAAHPRGVTLYEVMVSMAILLPALTVLGQAIVNGGRAAVQAQFQTEAVLRADSLMSELIAGAQPLSANSGSLFPDSAVGWTWSLEINDGPYPGLLELDVTVVHQDSSGRINATANLTRLLRDPQVIADMAAQQAELEAEEEEAEEQL